MESLLQVVIGMLIGLFLFGLAAVGIVLLLAIRGLKLGIEKAVKDLSETIESASRSDGEIVGKLMTSIDAHTRTLADAKGVIERVYTDPNLRASVAQIAEAGLVIAKELKMSNSVLKAINEKAFAAAPENTDRIAPERVQDSGVYGYKEADAAENELRQTLRASGVEVEPGRVPEPASKFDVNNNTPAA